MSDFLPACAVPMFPSEKVKALTDSLMKNNLLETKSGSSLPAGKGLVVMERELKAIIQQYMERMTQDRLTVAAKPGK